jgi:putative transposase
VENLFLLNDAQMRRIGQHFPLSHGVPRGDDRYVVSAILFVLLNETRWTDLPAEYGPRKTIYNRFLRWSELGVFNDIFVELANLPDEADRIVIDVVRLKFNRTAAHLLQLGCFPDVSNSLAISHSIGGGSGRHSIAGMRRSWPTAVGTAQSH